MRTDRYHQLAELYPDAVVRGGRTYPALAGPLPPAATGIVVDPSTDGSTDPRTGPRTGRPVGGPAGQEHLARRLRADPHLVDGPTACWRASAADGVHVVPGRYFDMIATCDALRAEFEEHLDRAAPRTRQAGEAGHTGTAGPADEVAHLPLRSAVHALGDPLASGAGRSAAIGVSVILTVPAGRGGRAFLIGRRDHVSADRDLWHVAPSGMLELDGTADPVAHTVAAELAEELGLRTGPDPLAGRLEVLGLAHDLLRLKPDLVVRLDLTAAEVPARFEAVAEFGALALVAIDPVALTEFWAGHGPDRLTPAAAGAIALVESLLAR